MARNDLVLQLVKSGVAGDRDASRRVAEALVADERSKQRSALAERLESALQTGLQQHTLFRGAAASKGAAPREDIVGLQTRIPERRLESICLSDINRTLIEEFIEEQERSDLLRSHGIEPRHTILLVGPPGTGKTSLAEAIATSLALPLHVVKYDTLVGSYLGETSARLRRVFEHARTNPCVLFFDEFDAIGKERGDATDVGELKRVVASLLTQIDEMPATSVIICATNHSELLDSAAWRRFELRMTIGLPTTDELTEYFSRFQQDLDEPIGISPASIAQAFSGGSYADAEAFCLDARRKSILSLGGMRMELIIDMLLERRPAQAPIVPGGEALPVPKAPHAKNAESPKLSDQTAPSQRPKRKRAAKRAGGPGRTNARSPSRPSSTS